MIRAIYLCFCIFQLLRAYFTYHIDLTYIKTNFVSIIGATIISASRSLELGTGIKKCRKLFSQYYCTKLNRKMAQKLWRRRWQFFSMSIEYEKEISRRLEQKIDLNSIIVFLWNLQNKLGQIRNVYLGLPVTKNLPSLFVWLRMYLFHLSILCDLHLSWGVPSFLVWKAFKVHT